MKMIHVSLAAMGLGVLLIVLSVVWPRVVGTDRLWSEEQARDHSQAAAELHGAIHQHGHAQAASSPDDSPSGDDPVATAKARYEQSQQKLQAARAGRRRSVWLLKWAGVCCCLAGAAGYFAVRQTAG